MALRARRALLAQQVHRVAVEDRATKGCKVHKVRAALLVPKVAVVERVTKVFKVLRVTAVQQVLKAPAEPRAHK